MFRTLDFRDLTGMAGFFDLRDLIISLDFPNYDRSPLREQIMLFSFISFY